jgi:hypothetical protein
MSSDNPTFAEIAEENIRQYREKPVDDWKEQHEEDCECEQCLTERMETMWEDARDAYD